MINFIVQLKNFALVVIFFLDEYVDRKGFRNAPAYQPSCILPKFVLVVFFTFCLKITNSNKSKRK